MYSVLSGVDIARNSAPRFGPYNSVLVLRLYEIRLRDSGTEIQSWYWGCATVARRPFCIKQELLSCCCSLRDQTCNFMTIFVLCARTIAAMGAGTGEAAELTITAQSDWAHHWKRSQWRYEYVGAPDWWRHRELVRPERHNRPVSRLIYTETILTFAGNAMQT